MFEEIACNIIVVSFLFVCTSGRRSWRGNGTGARRGDGEGLRDGHRGEVRRSPARFAI